MSKKIIKVIDDFVFTIIVYSNSQPENYGVFEVDTLRLEKNNFLFRGANPNAYSLTPTGPGVIVSFFRYNGESNIYYSHRIEIVENLHVAAPMMGQTPNNLATSGRIMGYAYQPITPEVFHGLNVANLNQLINGPDLITPAGPFFPVGRMVDVLRLLGDWIRSNFPPDLRIIDFTDDHPQRFMRPSQSYDSEGGGSGVAIDPILAFQQKNPDKVHYLDQRKDENEKMKVDHNSLLQQGTAIVKDVANGIKITGISIWDKAKGLFNRGKDAVSSKTSSAVVKVENKGNTAINAGKSAVTSVKNEGTAAINAGKSAITSVKDEGIAAINAGKSAVASVRNEGTAAINAGKSVITSVKDEGTAVLNAGQSAIDSVKKDATIIVKTGEAVIDTAEKEGNALFTQGGAAIAEFERDGAQFAKGAEEMAEITGEIVGEMGRMTAGRAIVELGEAIKVI
ncbi:hypothetical protein ACTA71_011875 [Dictyostelium dimigraforme]